MRLAPRVWNLRSRRCFRGIERAFRGAREQFGFRAVHFSVLGNHIHLIAEAEDARALGRGMKGLAGRIAKGLNKLMGASGRVFADRYHARLLETPRAVRNALLYVLNNARKHYGLRHLDPFSSAAWFDGWMVPPPRPIESQPVARARTWLLAVGWRRCGRIGLEELQAG